MEPEKLDCLDDEAAELNTGVLEKLDTRAELDELD